MQATSSASTICWPSETRHVALHSSGQEESSLQQSQPCGLPTSCGWPMYQYLLQYHIDRSDVSTASYTARPFSNRNPRRTNSPSLSALMPRGVLPVKATRLEPTLIACSSSAFSHLRFAPSQTCQLVMPSGEIAFETAWYQPRFWPSSSRLPMFHVPPGAYHIMTFCIPTISYTPRSVTTRCCTRRYSPSLSCSSWFGVGPWMYTPGVAETATHCTSRPSFHNFSAATHTPHVPVISAGVGASDLTCSQPRG
mmetsp:Transcript_1400/g.4521  ORF Transcript_1400/g.4521 Transcript_1400/m.4521 type:complete len:252 (-) Transcript_1400:236-991(-)